MLYSLCSYFDSSLFSRPRTQAEGQVKAVPRRGTVYLCVCIIFPYFSPLVHDKPLPRLYFSSLKSSTAKLVLQAIKKNIIVYIIGSWKYGHHIPLLKPCAQAILQPKQQTDTGNWPPLHINGPRGTSCSPVVCVPHSVPCHFSPKHHWAS